MHDNLSKICLTLEMIYYYFCEAVIEFCCRGYYFDKWWAMNELEESNRRPVIQLSCHYVVRGRENKCLISLVPSDLERQKWTQTVIDLLTQYRITHFVSVFLDFNLQWNDMEWEIMAKSEKYCPIILMLKYLYKIMFSINH